MGDELGEVVCVPNATQPWRECAEVAATVYAHCFGKVEGNEGVEYEGYVGCFQTATPLARGGEESTQNAESA